MSAKAEQGLLEPCLEKGPQSALETRLIDEYLRGHGHSWAELHRLPEAEAKRLLEEACRHAAIKLAHIESTAQARDRILK